MSTYFSLSRAGLEVYTTNGNDLVSNSTNDTGEGTVDSSTNFSLDKGDITRIDYLGEIYSDSFESDYTDISNNASVSVPIEYLPYFYKGRRVALRKGLQKNDSFTWEDMVIVTNGYVTELSYSKDKADIKITGMNRLLDENATFQFKKTKRSRIVEQIIEKSGLKAKVDVTGLKDDVIDFKSGTTDTNSNSSASNADVSADIQKIIDTVVSGETDQLTIFKKLHEWGVTNIDYEGYECSKYNCDPDKCLKNKSHLNCGDTAVLMHAIYTGAGLENYIIHGNYHFWNIVTINGTKYASDCSGNHKINEVWSTGAHPNKPFQGSKANPEAICG